MTHLSEPQPGDPSQGPRWPAFLAIALLFALPAMPGIGWLVRSQIAQTFGRSNAIPTLLMGLGARVRGVTAPDNRAANAALMAAADTRPNELWAQESFWSFNRGGGNR